MEDETEAKPETEQLVRRLKHEAELEQWGQGRGPQRDWGGDGDAQ